MRHVYIKIMITDEDPDYSAGAEFDTVKGGVRFDGTPFPAELSFMNRLIGLCLDYRRGKSLEDKSNA